MYGIINKRNFINNIFIYNHKLLRIRIRLYWNAALLRFLFNQKLDIPVMDFNLTTRCTFRCEQCAPLMTFYPNDKQ